VMFCFALIALASAMCPPANFSSIADFDLDSFISARWYIQQQAATKYLPVSQNRCVFAEYKKETSFWGYDLAVHNHAEDEASPHAIHDSGSKICAKIVDAAKGQLKVAPCFLPTFTAGEYWVIAYDEAAEWALISGGPPTVSAPGGCQNTQGVNGSGLWIFTRKQHRDEALLQQARAVATSKGFDLSVLNDVDQTGCSDPSGKIHCGAYNQPGCTTPPPQEAVVV